MFNKLKMAVLASLTALALTACSVQPEDTISRSVISQVKQAAYDSESIRIAGVATVLADPKESEYVPENGKYAVTCAVINGKNRMGGYTGNTLNLFVSEVSDLKKVNVLEQVDDNTEVLTGDVSDKFKAVVLILPESTKKCVQILEKTIK